MKYGAFFVTVLVVAIVWTQSASAHVLITDETKKLGAVLHIIPDDDPVAGEAATIFFDLQDTENKPENGSVTLNVTSIDGEVVVVPMEVDGSLATAKYTFPVQGQYRLEIAIIDQSGRHKFTYTQRVSRGTVRTVLDEPRHVWAEAALVGSFVILAIGGILAWNRRGAIKRTSRL